MTVAVFFLFQSQQKWKEYREELVLCIDQLLFLDTLLLDKFRKPFAGVSDAIWEKFCEILKNQLKVKPVNFIAIVIDDNMYYTSMRHRYYQLARKRKSIIIHWFMFREGKIWENAVKCIEFIYAVRIFCKLCIFVIQLKMSVKFLSPNLHKN